MGPANVLGPQACGQPKARAVGQGEDLIVITKARDTQHRAEHFFVHYVVFLADFVEDRWLEEVTLFQPDHADPLAAIQDFRTFFSRALDHALVFRKLGAGGDWAHLRFGQQRVAHPDLSGATHQATQYLVIDAFMHISARACNAGLTRRGEDAREYARHG